MHTLTHTHTHIHTLTHAHNYRHTLTHTRTHTNTHTNTQGKTSIYNISPTKYVWWLKHVCADAGNTHAGIKTDRRTDLLLCNNSRSVRLSAVHRAGPQGRSTGPVHLGDSPGDVLGERMGSHAYGVLFYHISACKGALGSLLFLPLFPPSVRS